MAKSPQSFTAHSIELPQIQLAPDRRQWVHICPNGVIKTRDGRGPYRLDNPQAVIVACQRKSGRAKMLVDYDHQSMMVKNTGHAAVAAGWIVGLQARDDGIWAHVEWTEKAAAHIEAREYRYLSPVISYLPNGSITGIENVALTNSPNLHEMTALSRKESPAMDPKTIPNPPSVYSDTTDFTDAEMQEVRQILSLSGGSTPREVIDAIKALLSSKHSANIDPSRYVPIGVFEHAVKEANALRQGIQQSEAVTYVNDKIKAGMIAPYFREWAVDLCTKNKPAFDAFAEKTGRAFAPLFETTRFIESEKLALASRQGADGIESEICERMGLTSEQFNAAR